MSQVLERIEEMERQEGHANEDYHRRAKAIYWSAVIALGVGREPADADELAGALQALDRTVDDVRRDVQRLQLVERVGAGIHREPIEVARARQREVLAEGTALQQQLETAKALLEQAEQRKAEAFAATVRADDDVKQAQRQAAEDEAAAEQAQGHLRARGFGGELPIYRAPVPRRITVTALADIVIQDRHTGSRFVARGETVEIDEDHLDPNSMRVGTPRLGAPVRVRAVGNMSGPHGEFRAGQEFHVAADDPILRTGLVERVSEENARG
jgi:multidrug efflux pump subunit AcrA (membrane-fusion protein)